MYAVSHADTDDFEHFNDAPPGFTEITEAEFAKSKFFNYAPESIDHRQILNFPGEKCMLAVWMYSFYDGTGIALANDFWGGKVRYFRYGCDHDFRELSPEQARLEGVGHFGRCWHVVKCQKCNYVQSYDSSD